VLGKDGKGCERSLRVTYRIRTQLTTAIHPNTKSRLHNLLTENATFVTDDHFDGV
jgi:hypothetical protein